ncbi:PAS domain-containing protein [Massilia sp. LXY-6]|uniref:sensor domain-containing diguanylate cyclase n=1 Tax=Massilia sp. LXY-6 TaxID=3379823 RepID=UPI003EE327BC
MYSNNQSEQLRLSTLISYDILDSADEECFDRLTRLAARICETPMATITFVDATRQWFKSSVGLEVRETGRDIAFCAHAINAAELFVVEDAWSTPLFASNPLSVGEPGIRFYAGMPLVAPEGVVLGTLAVMDRVPRLLNSLQVETLETLALQVVAQLLLRRERKAAEVARANQVQKKNAFLQIANKSFLIGTWEMSLPERRFYWSDAMCDLHEMPHGTVLSWEQSLSFVVPSYRRKMMDAFEACLQSGQGWDEELEIRTMSCRRVWVRSSTQTLLGADGQVTQVQGILRDISNNKESEYALIASEQSFRHLADAMPYIVWSAEPDGQIDYGNRAIIDYAGLQNIDRLADEWIGLLHPDDVGPTLSHWMESVRSGDIFSCEYRLLRADQTYRWHLAKGMPIRDDNGTITKWYGTTMDIHDMKLAQEEIGRLAFYDPLTQLPNRQLLMDRLAHALSLHAKSGRMGAVMVVDLDNFKVINDTLGHCMGDLLLDQVASRLTGSVTSKETVARLGKR